MFAWKQEGTPFAGGGTQSTGPFHPQDQKGPHWCGLSRLLVSTQSAVVEHSSDDARELAGELRVWAYRVDRV